MYSPVAQTPSLEQTSYRNYYIGTAIIVALALSIIGFIYDPVATGGCLGAGLVLLSSVCWIVSRRRKAQEAEPSPIHVMPRVYYRWDGEDN